MKLGWIVFALGCGPGSGVRGSTTPPPTSASVEAHGASGSSVVPDVPGGDAAKRDAELAVQVAGFVDAFTNADPILTRDGKRVVFVSSRDGLPQLYVADARDPGAPATRLVSTSERVDGAFATEEGRAVIFRSDRGADENWSFFRVDLDGKNLIELTPGAKLRRDRPIIPDGKPSTIFFAARKPAEARTTVYTTSSIAAGEPKALYADDKPVSLLDVSPDGRLALVRQMPSRLDHHLLLLDVASGRTHSVFPTAGIASTFDAKFSPDGKRVYLATDGGEAQSLVLAIDPQSGKVLAKHAVTPGTAQIGQLIVAKEGGAIAVSLTVGNHSEIRLLDGKKLTPRAEVKLPLGQGHAHEFSQDGSRLAAEWSTPRTPTEIFTIDTATGTVQPLRREDRPSLKALSEFDATSVDIPASDGGRIPTSVYLPAGDRTKHRPVIVAYHGGPSDTAVLRWSIRTAFLLSQGYAVVEPNVRGSADPQRGDAFSDLETSARWVAAQPWADKDRLVVYGEGYGGYTTLVALARWPALWRAGVDLFGDSSSEIDAGKIVDPTFVFVGANAPQVPRSDRDRIVKALRQRRVPAEYMVADHEGHSLAHRETQIALFSRMARFLETYLR
ncbi:MAG: pop [Deltaproteobacteria bacterium]|nr:pop [Deltaproteobacteria bacterium]